MSATDLAQIEMLASQALGPAASGEERMKAHRTLLFLQQSASYLPQCRHILANSSSPYALLFASQSVQRILQNDMRNVPQDQRSTLQGFLFSLIVQATETSSSLGSRQSAAAASPTGAATNGISNTSVAPRQLPPFIIRSLVRTLCIATQRTWTDDPVASQTLLDDVVQLLARNEAQALVGLKIITELVGEFDIALLPTVDAAARRAATSFREVGALTRAFHISFGSVQAAHSSGNTNLVRQGLLALHQCLEYDFAGTGPSDAAGAIQCVFLPPDWAEHVARARALRFFFGMYRDLWTKVENEDQIDSSEDGAPSLVLRVLGLLTCIRRSVFEKATRSAFIDALLEGTTEIMRDRTGLSHSESCVHNLCVLLSRIKQHFQLTELVSSSFYFEWLKQLCNFTESALAGWQSVSSRSVHFLMDLWACIVAPTPFLKARQTFQERSTTYTEHQLQQKHADGYAATGPDNLNVEQGLADFVPRVFRAFIASRCDLAAAAALEESGGDISILASSAGASAGFGQGMGGIEDDPLDTENLLLDQFAPIPALARYSFVQAAQFLIDLFERAMQEFATVLEELSNVLGQQQSSASSGAASAVRSRLCTVQARLTTLTYTIGAIVVGPVNRVTAAATERLDELNAELSAVVFRLVIQLQQAVDSISGRGQAAAYVLFGAGDEDAPEAGWRLEMALLYFFQCFQNLYIEAKAKEDTEALHRSTAGRPTRVLFEDSRGYVGVLSSAMPVSGPGAGSGAGVGRILTASANTLAASVARARRFFADWHGCRGPFSGASASACAKVH